jgi:2-polyprenyl-3-methyl-5-hydroxy-6-metoxy-1,4-benzoquinol methylase
VTETSAFERADCPKCGSASSHVELTGKDYLHHIPGEYCVSECDQCGLWFQNPRPTTESLAGLYPNDYLPHTDSVPHEAMAARRRGSISYLQRSLGYGHLQNTSANHHFDWRSLRFFDPYRRWTNGVALLPQFVPDGQLLEVGCGSGGRLLTLRDHGWSHLHGIELVSSAAERARSLGFSIECGLTESLLRSYPDEYFDVIVSSMVLEHLQNPFDVVGQIAAKLKPDGQFLFSTISRDSLDAKLFGNYWAGFDFPRHLVYLREKDIRDLLSDRFERIEFFYQSAPIDFLRSSSWRQADGKGRVLDAIILKVGSSLPAATLSLFLAWLRLTCRVSIRCRRMW